MSPDWLSVQLSMRKDPVIYPSLDAGRVTLCARYSIVMGRDRQINVCR